MYQIPMRVKIAICTVVCVVILSACEPQKGGRYANAGDPCYISGATAVDEDSGHELVCKRDTRGNLTWLVK